MNLALGNLKEHSNKAARRSRSISWNSTRESSKFAGTRASFDVVGGAVSQCSNESTAFNYFDEAAYTPRLQSPTPIMARVITHFTTLDYVNKTSELPRAQRSVTERWFAFMKDIITVIKD